jgi:hypothetical protein
MILPTWSKYLGRWWEEDLEANQQNLQAGLSWYASRLSMKSVEINVLYRITCENDVSSW